MSVVADILTEVVKRGVILQVQGDRLRFHPRAKIPADLVARLRDNKGLLITFLKSVTANNNAKGTPNTPANTSDVWPELFDVDREYLLGPHRFPGPCPFCGGRARHGALCNKLRQSWGPAMPWGKHRGKPLSEVPKDYLKWLLRKTDLRADLRADVERRLRTEVVGSSRGARATPPTFENRTPATLRLSRPKHQR